MQKAKRHWPGRIFFVVGAVILLIFGATWYVRHTYTEGLKPVSTSTEVTSITIEQGMTVDEIAKTLHDKGLIRSAWSFKLYVSSKEIRNALQAGTYDLEPSQSVPEIVAQLTHGKIATTLVTILPGQRLDQIRDRLIKDGFSKESVDAALDPAQYEGEAALVDKPKGASLEGYLYPDSFQKTANTDPGVIIRQSLKAMQGHLTPDIRNAFAAQNLSVYQGIVLASIVEQEVSRGADKPLVAQVFLKRIKQGMPLGSDPTAFYGSRLAGEADSVFYDSPYNTRIHNGLPPGPIGNVSTSSLEAVAHPANTDWLYFVAGDDGTTHFSKTLEEHETLTRQYCHELCGE